MECVEFFSQLMTSGVVSMGGRGGRETETETDRQTDRETDRQTDRETDRQTERNKGCIRGEKRVNC